MKRKSWGTAAVVLSASLALSACGGKEEKAPAAASGADDLSRAANEKAELIFYSMSRDSEESFNERYGDAIRKKFPNYTITYIQRVVPGKDLNDLINAGQRIDIQWDSIGSFPTSNIASELNFDMTELLKKHQVDLNRFEPSLIDMMKQLGGGAIYGLPVYNERMAMYYNKDLFDKLNVSYPKDGMTWDQFNELTKKLNVERDGIAYTGFSPSVNHLFLVNPYSLPLIDKTTMKSTINSDRWKQLLQTQLIDPTQSPVYQKAMTDYKKILDLTPFSKEQRLATFPSSPVLPLVQKTELSNFNWDIVSMPTMSDLPGVGPQSYPGIFAITKQAQNKDAAMQVLKFLTSDEFQMDISKKGLMTTLKNEQIQKALGSEGAFKGKNYGAFFYNKYPKIADKSVEESKANILALYTKNLNKLASGQMDINTYLRTAEEEANKALDDLKKK